jgi:teichuronic acid biosynthesis glycosyltransferase TuaG
MVYSNEGYPIVSVIIPVYNAFDVIEQSVMSVLNQSLHEIEIIIVDDCSSDCTIQIIENLQSKDDRITLVKNETNEGVANTRNKGIANARGKYIAFLDSDDIWHPLKLQIQLECLERTGADICYSSYRFIDNQGIAIGSEYIVPLSVDYRGLLRENVIGCSTAVIRAEALRGFYMKKEYSHEDYVLWLELLRAGKKAVGVEQVLVDYRTGGRSSDKLQAAKNRWIVYRKSQGLSLAVSLFYFSSYVFRAIKKFRGL